MGAGTGTRLTALLNVHSFFSQGAGISSPRILFETAVAQGYSHLCLTDHFSVGGAVELYQAANEYKLIPLASRIPCAASPGIRFLLEKGGVQ
jgi:error-prone DNA polymerase